VAQGVGPEFKLLYCKIKIYMFVIKMLKELKISTDRKLYQTRK
jgi:hypothetical protein